MKYAIILILSIFLFLAAIVIDLGRSNQIQGQIIIKDKAELQSQIEQYSDQRDRLERLETAYNELYAENKDAKGHYNSTNCWNKEQWNKG
jgi:hypothetical protein